MTGGWLFASLGLALVLFSVLPRLTESGGGNAPRAASTRENRTGRRAMASVSLAAAFVAAGGSPLVGLGLATSAFRVLARWTSWRGTRWRIDESAVAAEAGRALARELAMGCSTGEAVSRAGRSLMWGITKDWLSRAATLIALGEIPATALRNSLPGTGWELEHVVEVGCAGLPGPARSRFLLEVVKGIESDVASRAELRGNLSEPRFVAVAIPVLGVVLATVLALFEPGVLTVSHSMLGMSICVGCFIVCVSGAVVVQRLTRV